MAVGIEHRRAEADDAWQQRVHHARRAALAHLVEQLARLRHRDGQIGASQFLRPRDFFLEHRRDRFARHIRREAATRRRGEQRHHVAQPQVHRHGMARFFPVDDGRTVVAPHRECQRVTADLLHDPRHPLAREPHGVDARERRETEPERRRPEVIAGAERVLRHQFQPLKAHQIAVCLGRAHAGSRGEIAQHERPLRFSQHVQQTEADLDRLDSRAFLHRLPVPLELRLGKFISQCVMCWNSSVVFDS